jgi:hypothetical protein
MTWHKNINQINNLWSGLKYFSKADYAIRIGNAYRDLLNHIPADTVFKKNFHSSEGWYSQLVFKTEGIKVKIISRGFDDFFREPVMLQNGKLFRCQIKENITECHNNVMKMSTNASTTVHMLPPMQVIFVFYVSYYF